MELYPAFNLTEISFLVKFLLVLLLLIKDCCLTSLSTNGFLFPFLKFSVNKYLFEISSLPAVKITLFPKLLLFL